MVGAAILTMAGDGTAGTVRVGVSAGAAGTAVVGGDTIIITTTTTIILDGIMEAVAIGEMHIPIDVLTVRAVLLMPETEYRPLLPAVLLLYVYLLSLSSISAVRTESLTAAYLA